LKNKNPLGRGAKEKPSAPILNVKILIVWFAHLK
jgi:hypothetical protein